MDKLVTVYKAKGEMEAQVIKSLLESHGIACYFRSSAAPSVHVFTIDGLGEIKILVAESDAEDAQRLIRNQPNSA